MNIFLGKKMSIIAGDRNDFERLEVGRLSDMDWRQQPRKVMSRALVEHESSEIQSIRMFLLVVPVVKVRVLRQHTGDAHGPLHVSPGGLPETNEASNLQGGICDTHYLVSLCQKYCKIVKQWPNLPSQKRCLWKLSAIKIMMVGRAQNPSGPDSCATRRTCVSI